MDLMEKPHNLEHLLLDQDLPLDFVTCPWDLTSKDGALVSGLGELLNWFVLEESKIWYGNFY